MSDFALTWKSAHNFHAKRTIFSPIFSGLVISGKDFTIAHDWILVLEVFFFLSSIQKKHMQHIQTTFQLKVALYQSLYLTLTLFSLSSLSASIRDNLRARLSLSSSCLSSTNPFIFFNKRCERLNSSSTSFRRASVREFFSFCLLSCSRVVRISSLCLAIIRGMSLSESSYWCSLRSCMLAVRARSLFSRARSWICVLSSSFSFFISLIFKRRAERTLLVT